MFAWSIHLPADSTERIYSFVPDGSFSEAWGDAVSWQLSGTTERLRTFTKAAMKVILGQFLETIHSTGMPKCHEGDRLCQ
jgi:hypothetical protein